ncbi:MAG: hypothetical protein ABIJ20_01065 [Nanoarchaeota archaeon]|nr:hypothetical protein [Nanoarchaeota archaeon]MBU1445611.1 hypothetical protein [Nanoarchaeota archaeon]MBU2420792.1 hypothetical protein [Nanoarchaeota archaeon]MBU2475161.1 hypothetical protein [Nanoarchaeota archaeon]
MSKGKKILYWSLGILAYTAAIAVPSFIAGKDEGTKIGRQQAAPNHMERAGFYHSPLEGDFPLWNASPADTTLGKYQFVGNREGTYMDNLEDRSKMDLDGIGLNASIHEDIIRDAYDSSAQSIRLRSMAQTDSLRREAVKETDRLRAEEAEVLRSVAVRESIEVAEHNSELRRIREQ